MHWETLFIRYTGILLSFSRHVEKFIQCQYSIHALNVRASRGWCTTARLITDHFAGHGCKDDLKTE